MTTDAPIQLGSPTFTAIFQQNWENVRSIKSERIWFMNTYSVISAGTLSLLQSIHGETVVQLPLIFAMCAFSVMGLLISLRLKAELEECLQKVDAMVVQAQVQEFVALGGSEGALSRYPQFRWMFPVFYSFAVMLFVALFVYRISTLWQ
jgi:Na+/melibiose symporter-like transporter